MSPPGNSLLVVDHHLDPALSGRLEQIARQAECALRRWTPGQDLDQTHQPQVLLAALQQGVRRMPTTVAHLADEVFPGAPVLLLSNEPLIQPYVLMQGGRLTLLGAPFDPALLAERITASLRWRAAAQERGPLVKREDLRAGRGRMVVVEVEDPNGEPAARLTLTTSMGLTAVLSGAAGAEVQLERDLLPAIDGWQDQPDSAQLRRALGTRNARGWSSMVHLDQDGSRWLVAAPARWPLVLTSALRLPPWWSFPPADLSNAGDEDCVRVLTAEPGDVLFASAPLPEFPEFAPLALAKAAEGGAMALADHLAEAARGRGCALAAVAFEVRS